MLLKNTENSYGSVSKFLHWSLFFLVLIQAGTAFYTILFLPPKSALAGFLIGQIHKPFGVITFITAIFAIIWRLINIKPIFPATMPVWEKRSANLVHGLLYLCLLVIPLTGVWMSEAAGRPVNFFGLFDIKTFMPLDPSLAEFLFELHKAFAFVLIFLLLIHIGAAIKHHFIDKDNILIRMLPRK